MRTPIIDGQSIDQFIPANLRDMFYRHPMPQYKYAIHDGYDPYSFTTKGLVLYLPLWALKGSSFTSIDAYKHVLSVTGGVFDGQSWTVDGDDFITSTNALFAGTKDTDRKTINYWAYTPNNTGYGNTVTCRDAGGTNWQVSRSSGTYNLYAYDGTTNLDTGYDFVQNTWAFVTVILDGVANEQQIYVDLADIVTFARDFGPDDGGGVLNIGRYAAGGNDSSGSFGEIWIHNTRLTVAEIAHIFNSTKWRYP